jgi:4-amino-4-deoxy-L-arabinose transferase-like glycosyltransferase
LVAALRREAWWIAAVAGVTLVAAVVRLAGLSDLPPGLHGDEAWTGLDARRIHADGWIGVYVTSARGQPAGPLYWVAAVTALIPLNETTIRASMALLGVFTVPAAFFAFSAMFNRRTALAGTAVLAVMDWHFHFSRTAFLVTAWPLMEMLALGFLFAGLRSGRWYWWPLAGAALGLGFYTYNAYPLFALGVAMFLGWLLVRRSESLRARLLKIGLLVTAAVIVALPFVRYVADPHSYYFDHQRFVSTFKTEEWKSGSTGDRAGIIGADVRDYGAALLWESRPDAVDATNTSPLLDPITAMLAAAGVIVLLYRRRNEASVLVVLMLLLIPVAAIATQEGVARRTLGVTPFIAVAAGVAIDALLARAATSTVMRRRAATGAMALALLAITALNLRAYFVVFAGSYSARYTYATELDNAAHWIRDNVRPDQEVYFYSGRWSYTYETVRFVAPDARGEDRSTQYSPIAQDYVKRFGDVPLLTNRARGVVYVFLQPYLDQADKVAALYPGGTSYAGPLQHGQPEFRAYVLDVVPPATSASSAGVRLVSSAGPLTAGR